MTNIKNSVSNLVHDTGKGRSSPEREQLAYASAPKWLLEKVSQTKLKPKKGDRS